MSAPPPGSLSFRHPMSADHGRVLDVLDTWWDHFGGADGALQRALLLPRSYFQHFADTSWVVEDDVGALRGFLIGFLSAAQPDVA